MEVKRAKNGQNTATSGIIDRKFQEREKGLEFSTVNIIPSKDNLMLQWLTNNCLSKSRMKNKAYDQS